MSLLPRRQPLQRLRSSPLLNIIALSSSNPLRLRRSLFSLSIVGIEVLVVLSFFVVGERDQANESLESGSRGGNRLSIGKKRGK
jgi:hypothetical protein